MLSPANTVLIVVAFVFGAYQIIYGFTAFRRNHYHFYWIAGLLIGGPFLLAAVLTFLSPTVRYPLLEASVFLCWITGELWKSWMKKRAARKDPERWARWQQILEGDRREP